MPRRLPLLITAATVLAACALALGPGPASAVVPTKQCGTVSSKGKRYSARAHIVSCRFARRWTARFLSSGRRPRGWRCRRYSARVSRIAFVCRRRGTDYYAVRR